MVIRRTIVLPATPNTLVLTTLGGLAAIGLAVILCGITVITALAPFLALFLVGVLAGTFLSLVVRSS